MNVVVNGLMTNYQKVGKGDKTIVMLHGWGDSSQTFSKLSEKLQDIYEILLLDLPGIGQTQAPETAWGLDDYANFVQAWLQKVGIKDVYAVIAHSNGGAIAMRAVATHQLKPKKIVFLAAAGIRNNHKLKRRLLKVVSKGGKVITSPLPGHTKIKIRNRFYKRIGSEVGLFPHMEATFRKIITQDTQTDAKNIKVPTLLIYGKSDKVTPVGYGKIFHGLIDESRLEVIEAGHFLHQEQPDKIASLITKFLEEEKND